MKKCQKCAEEIQDDAKICKHCGNKQKKVIPRKQKIIMGVIWAILFIAIISSIGGESEDQNNTPQEVEITESQAYTISKIYVESILKSPSTADFPFLDYTSVNLGDDKFIVSSYVDSQNSFGAEIRSNWTTTLSYNGGSWTDTQNWILHELIFNGEKIYPLE